MMGTEIKELERVNEAGRLGELYRRHAGDAARLAYLITGDRALAEDLAHEAFVRLIGRFRDLRNPESFEFYLRRTVANLARAYLRDPSILIIEEPTAAIDEDTTHLIDDTIVRLAQGRTLIFLPHRLATIRSCSKVFVLHNGRIVATGSPSELQGESELFRHLQYVEFNQFATGDIEAGQMNA